MLLRPTEVKKDIPSPRICDSCNGKEFSMLLDELKHQYVNNDELSTWNYSLIECDKCGLGMIDPKPNWQLIQSFYQSDYGSYASSNDKSIYQPNSVKFKVAKIRASWIFSRNITSLRKTALGCFFEWLTGRTFSFTLSIPLHFSKDAHIIDIGYGSGNWLNAMSEMGYNNLWGYDIDANTLNAKRLIEKGIKVSSGEFLKNEYPLEKFDCIRLEHVFEHLLKPVETLQKCHEMLKPDGVLVMSMPCKNSWSYWVSIADAPALQVPQHLFHHTQNSLKIMLEKTNFTRSRIKAYSVSSQLGGTVNSLLKKKNGIKINPVIVELAGPLYRLAGLLTGKGDFMTVLAKKK